MKLIRPLFMICAGLSIAWACDFDDALREYLHLQFWLPFAKHSWDSAKDGVPRAAAPYAGMGSSEGRRPLARLRAVYQGIAIPDSLVNDQQGTMRPYLDAARRDPALTPLQREEIDLLDAKIDMRSGSAERPEPLQRARRKLTEFLRRARSPEYLSEARGWIAHIDFRLGNDTAAGKFYLDELNRGGSNLSGQTLLSSLRLVYGYDGGTHFQEHLDEYFDTPEHAAFAIQLVTNPHWNRYGSDRDSQPSRAAPSERIRTLLDRHRSLFRSEHGAGLLAELGMRNALRAGDPRAALRIANAVPPSASVRRDPDFLWMQASAHVLSRRFASAEGPLLRLWQSRQASDNQRAAAAYGLCGVYQKRGNWVEQIRFALWLHTEKRRQPLNPAEGSRIEDLSVYWAMSGWDLSLLLDSEAPIEELQSFLQTYPRVPDRRIVQYSLAVRLARARRYEEAAAVYDGIRASRRAARMRRLAELERNASTPESKLALGHYLAANAERLYFNDAVWSGLQRYALFAEQASGVTKAERQRLIAAERRLKDEQEERWQAYLLLRDLIREAGRTPTGERAANLALQCLRRISRERFGRESELLDAEIEIARWLKGYPLKS